MSAAFQWDEISLATLRPDLASGAVFGMAVNEEVDVVLLGVQSHSSHARTAPWAVLAQFDGTSGALLRTNAIPVAPAAGAARSGSGSSSSMPSPSPPFCELLLGGANGSLAFVFAVAEGGAVVVWDLGKQRLHCVTSLPHDGMGGTMEGGRGGASVRTPVAATRNLGGRSPLLFCASKPGSPNITALAPALLPLSSAAGADGGGGPTDDPVTSWQLKIPKAGGVSTKLALPTAFAVHPRAPILAVGCADGQIRLWDFAGLVNAISEEEGGGDGMALAPPADNGGGGGGGELGTLLATLPSGAGGATAAAANADGGAAAAIRCLTWDPRAPQTAGEDVLVWANGAAKVTVASGVLRGSRGGGGGGSGGGRFEELKMRTVPQAPLILSLGFCCLDKRRMAGAEGGLELGHRVGGLLLLLQPRGVAATIACWAADEAGLPDLVVSDPVAKLMGGDAGVLAALAGANPQLPAERVRLLGTAGAAGAAAHSWGGFGRTQQCAVCLLALPRLRLLRLQQADVQQQARASLPGGVRGLSALPCAAQWRPPSSIFVAGIAAATVAPLAFAKSAIYSYALVTATAKPAQSAITAAGPIGTVKLVRLPLGSGGRKTICELPTTAGAGGLFDACTRLVLDDSHAFAAILRQSASSKNAVTGQRVMQPPKCTIVSLAADDAAPQELPNSCIDCALWSPSAAHDAPNRPPPLLLVLDGNGTSLAAHACTATGVADASPMTWSVSPRARRVFTCPFARRANTLNASEHPVLLYVAEATDAGLHSSGAVDVITFSNNFDHGAPAHDLSCKFVSQDNAAATMQLAPTFVSDPFALNASPAPATPAQPAPSFRLHTGEHVVELLWQSLPTQQPRPVLPLASAVLPMLAVLTTRRLILVNSRLERLVQYKFASSRNAARPRPTSCLWLGATLLFSTDMGHIRYLVVGAAADAGGGVLLCSVERPSAASTVRLLAALPDRLVYAVDEVQGDSSNADSNADGISVCTRPLFPLEALVLGILGVAERCSAKEAVAAFKLLPAEAPPAHGQLPPAGSSKSTELDVLLAEIVVRYGSQPKEIPAEGAAGGSGVSNEVVHALRVHGYSTLALYAARGGDAVVNAKDGGAFSPRPQLSCALRAELAAEAGKWEEALHELLGDKRDLQEHIQQLAEEARSSKGGGGMMPGPDMGLGPDLPRLGSALCASLRQLATAAALVGEWEVARRALEIAGDDWGQFTLIAALGVSTIAAGSGPLLADERKRAQQCMSQLARGAVHRHASLHAAANIVHATQSGSLGIDETASSLPMPRYERNADLVTVSQDTCLPQMRSGVAAPPSGASLREAIGVQNQKEWDKACGRLPSPLKSLRLMSAWEWAGSSRPTQLEQARNRWSDSGSDDDDEAVEIGPLIRSRNDEDAVFGYWRFEEGMGAREPSAEGEFVAFDKTVHEHNGVLVGDGPVMPQYTKSTTGFCCAKEIDDWEEQALSCGKGSGSGEGAAGWGVQVAVKTGGLLDIGFHQDDSDRRNFTLEIWARLHADADVTCSQVLACRGSGAAGWPAHREDPQSLQWSLQIAPGGVLQASVGGKVCCSRAKGEGSSSLVCEKWYHIALAVDAQNRRAEIFLGGRSVGSGSIDAAVPVRPATDAAVMDALVLAWKFQGEIAEVRFWGKLRKASALEDGKEWALELASKDKKKPRVVLSKKKAAGAGSGASGMLGAPPPPSDSARALAPPASGLGGLKAPPAARQTASKPSAAVLAAPPGRRSPAGLAAPPPPAPKSQRQSPAVVAMPKAAAAPSPVLLPPSAAPASNAVKQTASLIGKRQGVLFENDVLEVGIRHEFSTEKGCLLLSLSYKSKSADTLTDFSVADLGGKAILVRAQPAPTQLAPGAKHNHNFLLEATQVHAAACGPLAAPTLHAL